MFSKEDEVVTRQPYRKVWLDHLLSKEIEVKLVFEDFLSKKKRAPDCQKSGAL